MTATTRSPPTPPPGRPRTLYLFHQEGCDYCADALSALAAFRSANPAALVITCNVTYNDWTIGNYNPSGTPSYLLRETTSTVATYEQGPLTARQLTEFYATGAVAREPRSSRPSTRSTNTRKRNTRVTDD